MQSLCGINFIPSFILEAMSNGNQKDTNANSFIIFIPIWLAVMLSCLEIGKALQTEKRMTANINETENKPATRKTEINYVVKGDVTKTRPILAIFFPGDKFVGKNGLRGSFYRYRATQNSVSLDQIATYHISRTLSATNLSSLINESQADEGGSRSCSQSNTVACHSYVRSWTYFYLKVRKYNICVLLIIIDFKYYLIFYHRKVFSITLIVPVMNIDKTANYWKK